MKFEQYKMLKEHALVACTAAGTAFPAANELNPILLAYIGDVVFSMYVRLRLLSASKHVHVINDIGARMVSAVCQCQAMQQLESNLSEEETAVFRRGRNAKSTVPKSASVHEYRMATAFEALLGWLFLQEREERLQEIMDVSFEIISKYMQEKKGI